MNLECTDCFLEGAYENIQQKKKFFFTKLKKNRLWFEAKVDWWD